MDLYERDPTVTRAMALALMRQALELLEAVKEDGAAGQLRGAVDSLLRKPVATQEGLVS